MNKHISCSIKEPRPIIPQKIKDDVYIIEKTIKLRTHQIEIEPHKTQYSCLLKLYQDIEFDNMQLYSKEIRNKLNGYKQQDREKKRDITKLITYDGAIEKLITSKMRCYYCKGDVFILYNHVKQEDQWTLERIDNEIGHTLSNCEICCLKCNLKRRCMPSYLYKKSKEISKIVKLHD